MKKIRLNYLLYYFFSNLVFQKGIFMIYLTNQQGISSSDLATLEVFLILGMFLTEVPAGFIGDKVGRKLSVIIGLLALGISSFGYIVFDSFVVFCLLFFLEGMGYAFISGADQSLLYDNLKYHKQEESFLSILSLSMTLSYVALGFSSVLGGILQKYSWNVVYGLSTISIIIALVFFIRIKELSFNENDEGVIGYNKKANVISDFIIFIKKQSGKTIIIIFIVLGIFEATCTAYFMFSQKFFDLIGTSTVHLSIIMTVGRFLSGFGYFIAPKLVKRFKNKQIIIFSMLVTSVLIIFNFFNYNFMYYLSFIAIALLPYMSNVLNINFIHSLLPSDLRSSILSVGNMIQSVFLGGAYLLIGILLENTTLNYTVTVLGVIALIAVVVYIYVTKELRMEVQSNVGNVENTERN